MAKSWSLNQFVLRHFFSALIPGKSIIIQQDFVYFHGYWIHITMGRLSAYFELLDLVFGASAVYRLIKPIPQWLLEEPLERPSLEEKLRYIDRAIQKQQPQPVRC